MRKINKKSASLVALQLSTSLSPLTVLTQASADTVSDTVTKASKVVLMSRLKTKVLLRYHHSKKRMLKTQKLRYN